MKSLYRSSIALAVCILSFQQIVNAQINSSVITAKLEKKQWSFIKNDGQLKQDTKAGNEKVLYYAKTGNAQILCYPRAVAFKFLVPEPGVQPSQGGGQNGPATESLIISEAVMLLKDANTKAVIEPGKPQTSKYNYYLGHCPDGIKNVSTHNSIVYRNIYNKIDLELQSDKEGLKYSFIVYPGGNVSDIKIQWEGISPRLAGTGGVTYTNEFGQIKEQAPYSFSESGNEVPTKFLRNGSVISFEVKPYNNAETLVIDPLLKWGTYFGGPPISTGGVITGPIEDYEGIKDMVIDSLGYIYVVGETSDVDSGIATAGTYKGTYTHDINYFPDIYIAKFSPDGDHIWGTFYGDTMIDLAYSIVMDKNGGLYIGGKTANENMATTGAHQPDKANSSAYDGIIAKFDSTGGRVWATYYGGLGHDGVKGLAIDNKGYLYAAGYTMSDSAIATSGLNTTFGGHVKKVTDGGDAFLAKMDASNGKRIWGTYFGDTMDEVGNGIVLDKNGNITITGSTNSTSGIATSGAYQPAFAGGAADAFISRFSSSGSLISATYYGGQSTDSAVCITIDDTGNIYIAGTTYSGSAGLFTNGAYDTTAAKAEGFVAKFNANGSRAWASLAGGDEYDYMKDIAVDSLGKVYLLLETYSDNLQSDTAMPNRPIASDGLALILFPDGSRYWSAYIGGDSHDEANAIALDEFNGAFYVAGGTRSTDNIATDNTHDKFKTGFWDAFIVKFDTLGHCTNLKAKAEGPSVVCQYAQEKYGTIYDVKFSYQWIVEGGEVVFGANSDSVMIEWTVPGKGKLKVVATNEYNCQDSSEMEVEVLGGVVSGFSVSPVCLGDTLYLQNTDTSAAQWLWEFGDGNTSKDAEPKHVYIQTGNYTVRGTIWSSQGCSSMTEKKVRVTTAQAGWTATKLSENTFVFFAHDTLQMEYAWDFGDGDSSSAFLATHTFSGDGDFTVSLTVSNSFGCTVKKDSVIKILSTGFYEKSAFGAYLNVFPNPLTRSATVEYEINEPGIIKILIFDIAGKELGTLLEASRKRGRHSVHFDASKYEAGIYFIQLKTDQCLRLNKVIINK